VHQLDLHEFFDFLDAEFAYTVFQEWSSDLTGLNPLVKSRDGHVNADLAQITDQPFFVFMILLFFWGGLVHEKSFVGEPFQNAVEDAKLGCWAILCSHADRVACLISCLIQIAVCIEDTESDPVT